MKEWLGAMLILQVFITILPGQELAQLAVADIIILSATVVFVSAIWYLGAEKRQMPLCWLLFFTGIAFHIAGAIFYNTNRSDFVMITSWGIAMFINERRYYISFGGFLYAVLMVTMTITIISFITSSQMLSHAPNNIPLMCLGMGTVACNIYLLMVDFRYGKHRMDYFERYFDKIDELSERLSKILMADKPIEQVMWDVTRECIPLLGLDDFIIYLYDKDRNVLKQVAAYGTKGMNETGLLNPIEIEAGKGIVGRVFVTKKPVMVKDTSREPDYIVDDAQRFSELAVPILIRGQVFGVIDSEHPQKDFYKHTHLQLFNIIAAFCSIKAAQHEIRSQMLEAERNQMEVAKMKELELLKNKFITNISHDLKTPLSLILGPANQINKASDNDFVRQQALYIMKNTDHLISMVEQLLQLNSIESGAETVQRETVELNRMLDDMKLQYAPMEKSLGIMFHVRCDEELIVTTDGYKLSQCLHNLLQNAFKYNNKGGIVEITACKTAGGNIRIIITDNGIGIAKEEHEKIFDRFYKIDVNNHKGTGIGLSLVKEYVSQLNGKIELQSAYGKGSTFTIIIPQYLNANADALPASVVDNSSDADDKKALILVVEDHVELNDFIVQSLQQHDFKCMQAYNGVEAMQLMSHHIPDMIISDLMMPQMAGEELVNNVKESDSLGHIPVIILTAKNQVDNRIDLYQSGADNYIAKPFKMEELLAIVENTLKQRKNLRDTFYRQFMPGNIQPAHAEVDAGHTTHTDNKIVQACMDYVLAHLDDQDLNVNTLGIAIGMGRNRLQKEIKTATSLTPVEFIRSIRLHEAHKLLMNNSSYNISEIAYMTGFSNLSYFSRSFKVQFGYAPSEVVA